MLTHIPDQKETTRMLQALRDGKLVASNRLLRGLVHAGAIGRGMSPADALQAALDPRLAGVKVNFKVVLE